MHGHACVLLGGGSAPPLRTSYRTPGKPTNTTTQAPTTNHQPRCTPTPASMRSMRRTTTATTTSAACACAWAYEPTQKPSHAMTSARPDLRSPSARAGAGASQGHQAHAPRGRSRQTPPRPNVVPFEPVSLIPQYHTALQHSAVQRTQSLQALAATVGKGAAAAQRNSWNCFALHGKAPPWLGVPPWLGAPG